MPYRTAALTYAGILVGFKLWSIVLIYFFWGGGDTIGFLIGTHVLWFVLPVLLIWAPAMFWLRLVRVRRKRKALEDAEWNVREQPRAQR